MYILKLHRLLRLSLLACVIALLPRAVHADPVLRLTDARSEYPLGQYIGVLEDASGKLNIDDITGAKYRGQYRTFNEDAPRLGLSRSVFWVRLHLRNDSSQNDWMLVQRFADTHYLDLYVPGENGKSYAVTRSGNLRPFANRDIPHRRIIFSLSLDAGQERTVYLRYQSQTDINLNISLWTIPAFVEVDWVDSFWMGMFYGLLGLILITSLLWYLFLRKTSYLYLFAYIASTTAAYAFYDGYAQMYFSADRAESSLYFMPMLLSISMLALLGFGRVILSTPMLGKYTQYIYHALAIAWLCVFFITPFIDYITTIMALIPLLLVTPGFLLVVGVISWKWQKSPGRFLVFGLFSICLVFLGFLLAQFGYLDKQFFVETGPRIGVIAMVVFLSMSLVGHVQWLQQLRRQRSKALTISEKKFQAIFDQTFQMIVILSPAGIVLDGNKTALDYVKSSAADAFGKYIWEKPWWRQDPEQREKLSHYVKQVAAGELVSFEMASTGPDGEQRWIDFSLKPYKEESGQSG